MSWSNARVNGGSTMRQAADVRAVPWDVQGVARRSVAVVLATLLLAAVAIVFTPSGAARADTVFQSGQVFASVGFSTVGVYDPGSGNLLDSLTDDTGEPYTTGSVFDSSGNFYVADDTQGDISEFSPTGQALGQFATGLTNPESMVFDNQGNLYVGQQTTPYVAEFSPSGQRLPDIGPLATELYGDDWIDLSSDQCTLYYTSESTDVMRYNKCTNTQEPNFNQVPMSGYGAFEVRILQNGDVLVADSDSVLLFDENGNVIQTYSCASLPGCQGLLFAVSVDPNGTSFWTGDSISGDVWQVDIATGQVLQTFQTNPGYLYGLSVDDQLMAATSPTVIASTPTTLTVTPVTSDFSSPTPVSAVLTNSNTDTPISDEPVTFTLNGSETCTGTTDDTGTATCVITPGEPSSSYTLTASFSGDSSQSTPTGSTSTSTTFDVTPDTSSVTYTGPPSAVNGTTPTVGATVTTNTPTPDTPLANQPVSFTVGSGGGNPQTCSGTTDDNGDVSCTLPTLDQPVTDTSITTTYGGSPYETPITSTTPFTVTEPTTLTVNSATGGYAMSTPVSGVLTDTISGAPIAHEPVTLQLDKNESCQAVTDTAGTATCNVTPSEPEGTYPLTGTFAGDTSQPLELLPSNGLSNFVVTPDATSLTYTGATTGVNGQSLAVSGVLTRVFDGAPIAGRNVTFTLGTGTSAQTCSAVTNSTGAVACSIASLNQSPGPIPVTDTFAGDDYYLPSSAASTVNLPEGTQLTVTPTGGTYNGSTPITGTLINTYTNQPVPNEPVTLTVGGTQSCTADTNAQGQATCSVTPTESAGTYPLTGSFPGDTSTGPQLLPTNTTSTFAVTTAPTTFTYTGPTTFTNGGSTTLTGVLTSSEPTPGTPVNGQTVTITIGSGSSSQSCTGTTNAAGQVSCTIAKVNQSNCSVTVGATYAGNSYYQSSRASATATVQTPTTLTVSAGTATYGSATTLTGTLTNSVTGAALAGQTVTLTLNGSQSCTAATNASGVASCSITPNEAAGSYTVAGSFAGATTCGSLCLLASTGSNTFVVTKATTSITNTSPPYAVTGMPITLTGTLTTSAGSGPGGQTVTLTLGSGSTAQSCTGTASASGIVSCTISNVNQTAGTVPVTVTYGGSGYYQSSSTSATETTASLPSSGGFVVGDLTADGTVSGSTINGTSVNFWGSQYWKNNSFSGVVNAPASMKGYISNAPSLSCGVNWTSNPGNSSNPPSTVPVNMVTVVSSTITQSGSTELGNIKHLVIVQTEAGYGPAPGHDGDGKIIATIC